MASEIVPGLYVGSLEDAVYWAKSRPLVQLIYVHEDLAPGVGPLPESTLHLPFLTPADSANLSADVERLEAIAEKVDGILNCGRGVLIHCGTGVERAPLAAAWFLYRRRGMSLDDAYELIRSARPFIADRRDWLGSKLDG